MGTPLYMAPEQAHGKVDAIEVRTDVYALGAILYSILTLRSPIQGPTMSAILLKVAAYAETDREKACRYSVRPSIGWGR